MRTQLEPSGWQRGRARSCWRPRRVDSTREQLMWAGVLHAGPGPAVGGLTALELTTGCATGTATTSPFWSRSPTTCEPHRRRSTSSRPAARSSAYRAAGAAARSGRSSRRRCSFAALRARHAYGVRAALRAWSSSGLTTPARLDHWIRRMRPLRRAKPFRRVLGEIAGGAHSMSELDVSRMCRTHQLPAARPDRSRRRDSGRSPAFHRRRVAAARRARRRSSRSTAASTWTSSTGPTTSNANVASSPTGAIVLRCTVHPAPRASPGGWHATSDGRRGRVVRLRAACLTPSGGRPGQTGTFSVAT